MRFVGQLPAVVCLAALVLFVASGCSEDLPLADAGGTVTYNGKPVVGATVTFMSDSAPLAIGTTDESGTFELNTLGRSGAALGEHGVAITLMKDEREITPEEAQTMSTQELNKIRKSVIPAKYGHPRTSGLKETVNDDSDNRFTFDLKD